MAIDLSDTLVVGISATALFNMQESHALFETTYKENPERAIQTYRQHMLEREEDPLEPGTGLPVVRALLNLNQHSTGKGSPLVEVVILSRNSPETGVRVLKAVRGLGLGISRSAFTGGETVVGYLTSFDVDLFLTTDARDAQSVIDSGTCAAAVLSPPPKEAQPLSDDQVRFAFDGDAVLFDEESEVLYKTKGIDEYKIHEAASENVPMSEGPYANVLKKLGRLQERLPGRIEFSPVRIAIVTARNSPADLRVIKTLRDWGIYVDGAFFLGGVGKERVLAAYRPHIFFDDQDVHVQPASGVVPSGKVLYKTGSRLRELESAKVAAESDSGTERSDRRSSETGVDWTSHLGDPSNVPAKNPGAE